MNNSIHLNVTKIIRAKREKVFDACGKPELLRQWIAPGELTVPEISVDFKVGGTFSIHMEGMMRGAFQRGVASGKYTTIIPGERIVFTWHWSGYDFPETLVTIEFSDVKEGTEVRLTHERFADADSRDRYEGGWHHTLGKLDSLLQGKQADVA